MINVISWNIVQQSEAIDYMYTQQNEFILKTVVSEKYEETKWDLNTTPFTQIKNTTALAGVAQ